MGRTPLRAAAVGFVPRSELRALKLRDCELGNDHVLVRLRESRVRVVAAEEKKAAVTPGVAHVETARVEVLAHVETPRVEASDPARRAPAG